MKHFHSLIVATILALMPFIAHTQFREVLVEQVENEGVVPGKTYRIYAAMTNVNDQVFVVFGDSLHPLSVTSTKPFYQSAYGGALAKNTSRKDIQNRKELKYDSWVTIGAVDNYENNTNVLNMNFDDFEKKGGSIQPIRDGAWFCIPTDKQAFCKDDKKVLLMQLTTEGEINGTFSIMGKSKDGVTYTMHGVNFSCGRKSSGKK